MRRVKVVRFSQHYILDIFMAWTKGVRWCSEMWPPLPLDATIQDMKVVDEHLCMLVASRMFDVAKVDENWPLTVPELQIRFRAPDKEIEDGSED